MEAEKIVVPTHRDMVCRTELLKKVHEYNRNMQEQQTAQANTRRIRRSHGSPEQVADPIKDGNIELIEMIMDAIDREHDYL